MRRPCFLSPVDLLPYQRTTLGKVDLSPKFAKNNEDHTPAVVLFSAIQSLTYIFCVAMEILFLQTNWKTASSSLKLQLWIIPLNAEDARNVRNYGQLNFTSILIWILNFQQLTWIHNSSKLRPFQLVTSHGVSSVSSFITTVGPGLLSKITPYIICYVIELYYSCLKGEH